MKTYTQKQADKLHGIYTHNELARLFDLLPYDDETGQGLASFDDREWENAEEHALCNYAFKRGYDYSYPWTITNGEYELDIEKIRCNSKLYEQCLDDVYTEIHKAWTLTLESTIKNVLNEIDLTLQECKIKREDGYMEKAIEIVPCGKRTWREIATEMIDIISSYYFNTLTDFKANYGSTDRQASVKALESGKWHNWYGGQRKVEERFNDYLNHYLGYYW